MVGTKFSPQSAGLCSTNLVVAGPFEALVDSETGVLQALKQHSVSTKRNRTSMDIVFWGENRILGSYSSILSGQFRFSCFFLIIIAFIKAIEIIFSPIAFYPNVFADIAKDD
jgi:hypothetical protein